VVRRDADRRRRVGEENMGARDLLHFGTGCRNGITRQDGGADFCRELADENCGEELLGGHVGRKLGRGSGEGIQQSGGRAGGTRPTIVG
jgi:hypothetical protein